MASCEGHLQMHGPEARSPTAAQVLLAKQQIFGELQEAKVSRRAQSATRCGSLPQACEPGNRSRQAGHSPRPCRPATTQWAVRLLPAPAQMGDVHSGQDGAAQPWPPASGVLQAASTSHDATWLLAPTSMSCRRLALPIPTDVHSAAKCWLLPQYQDQHTG